MRRQTRRLLHDVVVVSGRVVVPAVVLVITTTCVLHSVDILLQSATVDTSQRAHLTDAETSAPHSSSPAHSAPHSARSVWSSSPVNSLTSAATDHVNLPDRYDRHYSAPISTPSRRHAAKDALGEMKFLRRRRRRQSDGGGRSELVRDRGGGGGQLMEDVNEIVAPAHGHRSGSSVTSLSLGGVTDNQPVPASLQAGQSVHSITADTAAHQSVMTAGDDENDIGRQTAAAAEASVRQSSSELTDTTRTTVTRTTVHTVTSSDLRRTTIPRLVHHTSDDVTVPTQVHTHTHTLTERERERERERVHNGCHQQCSTSFRRLSLSLRGVCSIPADKSSIPGLAGSMAWRDESMEETSTIGPSPMLGPVWTVINRDEAAATESLSLLHVHDAISHDSLLYTASTKS